MKKLEIYIPLDYKEKVKKALFDAGSGEMGQYKNCCFEYEGVGQFIPLDNSNAFIGEKNSLSFVKEVKVEMICLDKNLDAAIKALKMSHPYEEPAYFIIDIQ